MRFFIDRRRNPKDKNLGNRQRFIRRARAQIKKVVDKAIKERRIADIGDGEAITVPTQGIGEPRFHHAASSGTREHVLAGNRDFVAGDHIPRPPSHDGKRSGKKGAEEGEGEDAFAFALSRDEFLDLFFENLELPDLVKTDLKDARAYTWRRAGVVRTGTPANIDIQRTMRNSYARRLALKRPPLAAVDAIRRELSELESRSGADDEAPRLRSLRDTLDGLMRQRNAVPFVDPFDVRFRNFEPRAVPVAKAVMFCLMDVSGSMGEREKDLAKRFFIMLHLFLKRRYEHVDIVFVRHTHNAAEVDEDTFFSSRETGGTVVSTALTEMLRIVRARYPISEWNIYAAQASDGENFSGDSEVCANMLEQAVLPLSQYYAYIEILDEREIELFGKASAGAELWRAFGALDERWPNFERKQITRASDIYPVFRELFSRHRLAA